MSIFSKGDGRYSDSKENRDQFPVEKMCKVLKVSVSRHYYWLKHPISTREQKEQELVEQIKQIHEQRRCCYGSPRIAAELKEQGIRTSHVRMWPA
ncbi:IS3 family transposase [Pontibacter toksunensis]|uniref:IS3 family transposase n=1 Tax=Pontibacter toksunensis TaxID=1332631 RepID=A0ABW6C4P0_9BACT